MFRVKVTGTYIARSGIMDKEKIKKTYEIEGNIPTTKAALSIVKNKLLAPALAKKYSDYVTFLTYHIVEITPLDEASRLELSKSEITFMGREALVRYIKEQLPHNEDGNPAVLAEYYPDLFKLREAVQHAKDDLKGYQKQFALREPDLRLDLEMAACNPELYSDGPTVPLAASITTRAPRKVPAPAKLAKQTGDRLAGLTADQIRDGEMVPVDQDPGVNDL